MASRSQRILSVRLPASCLSSGPVRGGHLDSLLHQLVPSYVYEFPLTFARFLHFDFQHLPPLVSSLFSFKLKFSLFLPFYHFLYLSHLLIFNPASPPPHPPHPRPLPLPSLPPSSLFFSTSPEPSAPPQDIKCSSTSSTSLRVSWRPPPWKSQNGALVGYRVVYQLVGPSEGGGDEDFLQDATTSAGEEQVVLQRLEKWTQYRVSVSASTVVGPGPESEPLVCRTDEDGTPSSGYCFSFQGASHPLLVG